MSDKSHTPNTGAEARCPTNKPSGHSIEATWDSNSSVRKGVVGFSSTSVPKKPGKNH